MNTYDELKMLYGAYLGITNMDNYKTKEYVLEDIQKTIDEYIKKYNIYYHDEVYDAALNQSLITDLQDSLIVLKRLDEPLELILLIKEKIRLLKEEETRKWVYV